ncbi:MAG: pitrilysin family protein [Phycisphaerae bacterium]
MNTPRIIVSAVTLAALTGIAAAQDVKYEKYKLPNGMTVILHEDHALPIATVNIWYRVGAQDEPVGRSGFAHLFEHLMFMGTKRVPGSDFDNLMEAGGGANNASTDLHRTNYFSWGPAKLLPTLLWLDADRLEDMGLNMTQEKLDKQRDIVRNELRQTIENRPYGKAEEFVSRLMYPPGHPYHIGVAGLHEDLIAATVTNVKDFFANFYVPNNASLVVAGDFDPAEIKPLVEKLFGSLPRGAEVKQRTAEPVKLDKVARFTMIDKVQLPRVMYAYHSPRAYQDGDADMELAARVLTDGKNSRLYRRLVYTDQVAVDVSASQYSFPLGSIFQVSVDAKPDADIDKLEKTIDEEIARLVAEGPTAAELDEKRAAIEMQMLSMVENLRFKADRLNEYEYYWGEPNSFKRDLERYRSATPESVKTWASKVLTPGARGIIRVFPEEPQRPESPRDKRPSDSAQKSFTPQAPEAFKLSSGVPVMLWRRPELPLVSMSLSLRPGGTLDTPAQAGLAELTTSMLDEGAGDLDALAFSQAMQSLGAQFGAGAQHESANVSLTVLKRNFEKAAGLFADAVRRPRMDAKEWQRVKTLHLEDLKQQDDEPNAVAANVAARLLFGDKNPYGWPVDGTPETVGKLDLDQVKAAHANLFQPASAAFFVAGDITVDEAKALLEKNFGDWKPAGGANAAAARDQTAQVSNPVRDTGTKTRDSADFSTPKVDGLRVAIVHRPEAVQTVVRFLAPGVKYADAKRVPLRLLNTLLGGSFTSRLNQNLREAKGYTYGARSNFAMDVSTGTFSAGAAVKADVTGPALTEFFREFDRLRKGDVSDGEATKARETVRNTTVESFGGLRGVIGGASNLWLNNLPFDTIGQDLAAMEKVTAAELNALAKPSIALENGVLVLVGDRELIRKQISDLKLPTPTEYTVRGEPVKAEGKRE